MSDRSEQNDSIEYPMRHLHPANLSPLRRRLKKQLAELKDVNAQQPLIAAGHFAPKEGSRYLHTLMVGRSR